MIRRSMAAMLAMASISKPPALCSVPTSSRMAVAASSSSTPPSCRSSRMAQGREGLHRKAWRWKGEGLHEEDYSLSQGAPGQITQTRRS